MVYESDLEGFRKDRYFARSWALLTRDRGWIKPVLVMSVALLVPLVGYFGVNGYALEWARLTAWNINAAPKQKNVRVGECIVSGGRAFVISLVWALVFAIVMAIAGAIPLLGGLLVFLLMILNVFMGVFVSVAQLRATIYQKVGAGLRISTIKKMITHDFGGLVRIFGINLIGGALIAAVGAVVTLFVCFGLLPQLFSTINYLYYYDGFISSTMQAQAIVQMVFSMISSALPALILLLLASNIMSVVLSLLVCTSVGLWMRQFNVAAWGREEDPLPEPLRDPRDAQPYDPWASSGQMPYQQETAAGPEPAPQEGVTEETEAPTQDGPETQAPQQEEPAEKDVDQPPAPEPADLPTDPTTSPTEGQNDQPDPFKD